MTVEERKYRALLAGGILWELFPQYTGNWEKDKDDFIRRYGNNNMEQREPIR